jgi:Arc/MetJ-type ribon-helix-helix transcriptional regulator
MPESEKITINLGSVDLGKIDLLVEEGLYSNRTDFIRTAIRNLLDKHQDVVSQVTIRRSFVIGVLMYSRDDLLKAQQKGEQYDLRAIGSIVLDEAIEPELALATIQRIQIRGVLKASQAVKAALAERINPGMRPAGG